MAHQADLASRLQGIIAELNIVALGVADEPASDFMYREIAREPDPHCSLVQLAKEELDLRRRRAKFLPSDLFAEPAWDIMLDLYVHWHQGRRVSVTSACLASGVPNTTALRWLKLLEEQRLIIRLADKYDRRMHHVQLSEIGLEALTRSLSDARARRS